jgi:hypothetical protein
VRKKQKAKTRAKAKRNMGPEMSISSHPISPQFPFIFNLLHLPISPSPHLTPQTHLITSNPLQNPLHLILPTESIRFPGHGGEIPSSPTISIYICRKREKVVFDRRTDRWMGERWAGDRRGKKGKE